MHLSPKLHLILCVLLATSGPAIAVGNGASNRVKHPVVEPAQGLAKPLPVKDPKQNKQFMGTHLNHDGPDTPNAAGKPQFSNMIPNGGSGGHGASNKPDSASAGTGGVSFNEKNRTPSNQNGDGSDNNNGGLGRADDPLRPASQGGSGGTQNKPDSASPGTGGGGASVNEKNRIPSNQNGDGSDNNNGGLGGSGASNQITSPGRNPINPAHTNQNDPSNPLPPPGHPLPQGQNLGGAPISQSPPGHPLPQGQNLGGTPISHPPGSNPDHPINVDYRPNSHKNVYTGHGTPSGSIHSSSSGSQKFKGMDKSKKLSVVKDLTKGLTKYAGKASAAASVVLLATMGILEVTDAINLIPEGIFDDDEESGNGSNQSKPPPAKVPVLPTLTEEQTREGLEGLEKTIESDDELDPALLEEIIARLDANSAQFADLESQIEELRAAIDARLAKLVKQTLLIVNSGTDISPFLYRIEESVNQSNAKVDCSSYIVKRADGSTMQNIPDACKSGSVEPATSEEEGHGEKILEDTDDGKEHGSTLGNSYGTWDQSKNAPVEKNVNSNSNWDTSTYNQPSSTGGYEKDLRYDDKYYDDPNAYNGDWRFTEHEWEKFVKETRRQNAQKIVDILEW
ncbi:hypothetical protein FRC02_010288 [Tulasnella sp. 418]|nr:hypothetical protein FRC02_010288 [Tulasnella sp. 418]